MKKTLGISKMLCSLLLALTVMIGLVPATNVNAASKSTLSIHYFSELNYYYWNGKPEGSDNYNVEAIVDCPNWKNITRIDAAVVANNQYVMGPVCKTSFSSNLSNKIRLSENGELTWKFEINKLDANKTNYLHVTITYKDGHKEELKQQIRLVKKWCVECTDRVQVKSGILYGKFQSCFLIKEVHVAIYKGSNLVYINKFTDANVNLSRYKINLSNFSSGTYSIAVTAVDNNRQYLMQKCTYTVN